MRLLVALVVVAAVCAQDPNEDVLLTTPELIAKYGYPVETHKVHTADSYILTMHRIPSADTSKGVILLQHGALSSSADYILLGPGRALGYLLADAGYDVWMGNNRGNVYSREHEYLSPDGPTYWDFSWHEMGVYDQPAMVDYILAQTGAQKIFYVGHSQGTTQFYVFASEKPEYNSKIRAMFSLAPVAYMSNMHNPVIQYLSLYSYTSEYLLFMLGQYEVEPTDEFKAEVGMLTCQDGSLYQEVCSNIIFLIGGYDSQELNRTMLPVIMGHAPAGGPTKALLHYGQEVIAGRFQMFDYGIYLNPMVYGTILAPAYDLSKITAPVILYYTYNDILSAVEDVMILDSELGNSAGMVKVPLDVFNHLDYLWAIHAKELVYDDLMSRMENY